MVVWYLVPSRDPELLVAVGWEPVLGSFVARVEGVPTGALLDPDRPTVVWFGSRQGELRTVEDLQAAIGEYAVLGSDLRVALKAERTGRANGSSPPAASATPQLLMSNPSHWAQDQPSPAHSTPKAWVGFALMIAVVALLVLVLALAGAVDL